MSDFNDVTHREIYERLKTVELKVDKIETNTKDMVAAFNAAQGAFAVLEWLAKVAKPLLIVGGFLAAIGAAWTQIKIK
ncbi:hypothetical protein [Limnohabitans sp.]|uniref:hypothetical protein n=1 Tax=Limnohabitans sp. TaxID=1907725 RepID=UPI0025BC51F4|nr:hypothetical protein [Limnohabitans sp.]